MEDFKSTDDFYNIEASHRAILSKEYTTHQPKIHIHDENYQTPDLQASITRIKTFNEFIENTIVDNPIEFLKSGALNDLQNFFINTPMFIDDILIEIVYYIVYTSNIEILDELANYEIIILNLIENINIPSAYRSILLLLSRATNKGPIIAKLTFEILFDIENIEDSHIEIIPRLIIASQLIYDFKIMPSEEEISMLIELLNNVSLLDFEEIFPTINEKITFMNILMIFVEEIPNIYEHLSHDFYDAISLLAQKNVLCGLVCLLFTKIYSNVKNLELSTHIFNKIDIGCVMSLLFNEKLQKHSFSSMIYLLSYLEIFYTLFPDFIQNQLSLQLFEHLIPLFIKNLFAIKSKIIDLILKMIQLSRLLISKVPDEFVITLIGYIENSNENIENGLKIIDTLVNYHKSNNMYAHFIDFLAENEFIDALNSVLDETSNGHEIELTNKLLSMFPES